MRRQKGKRQRKTKYAIVCNCDSFYCHSQEHMQQPHPPLFCWIMRTQRKFRQSMVFRGWDEETRDRRRHGWCDDVSRKTREEARLDAIIPVVSESEVFSNHYAVDRDVVFGSAFPNRMRRTNVISEKHAQVLLEIEREQSTT